jgi:hypothetical protein
VADPSICSSASEALDESLRALSVAEVLDFADLWEGTDDS